MMQPKIIRDSKKIFRIILFIYIVPRVIDMYSLFINANDSHYIPTKLTFKGIRVKNQTKNTCILVT